MEGFIMATLNFGKRSWIGISICLFVIACTFVGCAGQLENSGIKERIESRKRVEFQTTPSIELDPNIQWVSPGNAKELINLLEKMVVIAGRHQPLPWASEP